MAKKVIRKPARASGKQKQIGKGAKLGEATAKRMKNKISAISGKKKSKNLDDEEIESVDSLDNDYVPKKDDFLVGLSDEEEEQKRETAEEKRLRMTKQIISDYATGENGANDFFATLTAKTTTDHDIINKDDDRLTKHLKMQALQTKGKLFY